MGIFKIILGAAEIAAGAFLIATGFGAFAGALLIASAAGMVFSGIGTLLSGDHQSGFATTERNPIAAWKFIYGRGRTGGSLVYINEWGNSNKILDMIIVLAAHPCQLGLASETAPNTPTMPAVYFDRKRVTINQSYVADVNKYKLPRPVVAGSGSSYSPSSNAQKPKFNWQITQITRANDVVTVTMSTGIPYLAPGDQVAIRNVSVDATLNGVFDVAYIVGADNNGYATAFTMLNGGNAATGQNQGQVAPLWADYSNNVYVEFLDGTQALGQTFVGFEAGTPWKGTGQLINPASPGPAGFSISGSDIGGDIEQSLTLGIFGNGGDGSNISAWSNFASLQGKTALMVRLTYDQTLFPGGIPQISTLLRGKNDIYDPRTGTYGYTENAALCIADFLNGYAIKDAALRTNPPPTGPFTTLLNPPVFGYQADYGTDIPINPLIATANVCDLWVPILGGTGPGIDNKGLPSGPVNTEPMYSLNGQFTATMRRGEILQNMLTACAGRISEVGGQFFIQPGYWTGSTPSPVDLMAIAAGPCDWKPTVSIRELFNGVKGTYISPANGWQASDFPYYAQDALHGYDPDNLIPQYGGDANLQQDLGQRRWLDIQLPFTLSPSMAQRIAKIELLRRRNYGTGTFRCNMAAYQFIPFDILLATHSFLGWNEKFVEVVNCRLKTQKQTLDSGVEVMLFGIELDIQETDSSIYAWADEEQLSPQGYQQAIIPHGQIAEVEPWPWSPGYVAPLAGDATYPQGTSGLASFGLLPMYGTDAQGNQTLSVQIKGFPPFNLLDDNISKPIISATGAATGGTVPGGLYVLGLAARDSGAEFTFKVTDFLNACNVTVPDGTSGSIAVLVTEWGSGDDGADLYMAEWNADEEFIWRFQQTLAPNTTSTTISFFNESTPGGPDPDFDHFGVLWQQILHSGPWAETIYALTANTLTFGGDGMRNNQWAGYTLSLLAKATSGVEVPILNLPIAASTASSGSLFTLTIGPNSDGVQIPDLTTLLAVGDLMVMRHQATFTASSFSDTNIANGFYPDGATNIEAGHLAFVLSGTDIGDIQTIASVGLDSNGKSTIFNIQGTWRVTPQTGDVVVVCAPTQADFYATPNIQSKNSVNGAVVIAQPDIANLANQTWLLIVSTCDSAGNHGDAQYMPMRDIYFFGAGGTREVATDYTVSATDGIVNVNAFSGDLTITIPPLSTITNQRLRIQKHLEDTSSNTVTVQLQSGDSVTDGSGTWNSKVLTTAGDFVYFPGV